MPKKVIEFLREQAQKAGVQVESEEIKKIFELPELKDLAVMLPDELTNPIDNGLLSISAAKNNFPDIKNHYFAQAMNGLDAEMENLMEELKLPEETRVQLRAEKSSTKRAASIARKIRELEAQKANAGSDSIKQLNDEISNLNRQLREVKSKEEEIKTTYETKLRDKDKDYALRNILSKYKTIYDELPAYVKDHSLKAIIENALSTKGGELIPGDAGALLLKNKTGGGAFFGPNNQELSAEAFFDQIFAEAKILKLNDQNQNNNSGNNQNRPNNGQNNNYQNNNQPQNGWNNGGNNSYGNNNNNNSGGRSGSNTLSTLTQEALKNLEQIDPLTGTGGQTR